MANNYPSITCVCPTFARIKCLEEALFSFLTQDYQGNKKLVILNDYYDQELIYNHPEVVIINKTEQIKPLSKKYEELINYTESDLIAIWEDDDIYLPSHLTYTSQRLVNGHAWRNSLGYVLTGKGKEFELSGNYFFSSSVFTREIYNKVGGFTHKEDNCAFDVSFITKLQKELGPYARSPKVEDIEFCYRWGNNYWHGSGWGTNISDMSNKAFESTEHNKNLGKIPKGKIILEPKWQKDYVTKKNEFLRKAKNG